MSLEDYADIDLETVVPMTDEEVQRVREKIALLGAGAIYERSLLRVFRLFSACFPPVFRLFSA